ncbi:asparagine synthase (glutamine-hydrolyzing) [Sulfurimonas sp. NW7]|uniref:asparagine synthase (glutamine-hydrolyzing) n=1 Tax=Sulfurimonas sp. NW7 TaxID=2922727 RepID=UPI003DA7F587
MCGFVGYFGNENIDLENARKSINSRGPDMSSIESGLEWKVAFNRLSIHDLSEKGMQPFRYNDIVVYMNGEIFNYIELLEEHKSEFISKSGSDVEIIPFLYNKYGIDFLNKLNGMFAIVLIDEENDVKYLIRDRFAEKPLYYFYEKNILTFASEVKAIKKIKKLEIDKTNIQINFACWFLPQPFSLYKNTFNVNPGSYIKFKDGKIEETRWYNPCIETCNNSEEEIENRFIKLYKSAIELRLRSDVPVGVFLSGGLDSTSIAKFAKEATNNDFYAFGADISGKDLQENNNTDVEIPIKLANELNIKYEKSVLDYKYYNENIVKIIHHYDEIFINSGILVFYELANLAIKNDTKVILTGVGGDELFGGYPWQAGLARKIDKIFRFTYNKLPYSEFISKFTINLNRKIATAYQLLFDYKVWHVETLSSFRYDFKKDKETIEKRLRDNASIYFKISNNHFQEYDIYNIMGYVNTFTLIGSGNHFVDIATMNFSVENRSPFLDYRLYEFLMSVPDTLKSKYGQKGLLRKILKKHLPGYVTKAKKSGPTMPINTWFYDKKINENILKFINKHQKYLDEYLSLGIQLDKEWVSNKKNSLKLFAIISFIIWLKFNVLEDISNENITFEELITN